MREDSGAPAGAEHGRDQHSTSHSELSGTADNVVQARDVSGGVHFHTGPASVPPPTPAQLPGDVRGFVNRVADLVRLDEFLASGDPVCTIVGTAGVGKSSLAVHWAHRVRGDFPDGQLHLDLHRHGAGTAVTATDVLARFLEALGVVVTAIPTDPQSRAALYRTLLAGRTVLVLLNNAASAEQIRLLLPGAGSCRVLVTSRNRLALGARDGARRVGIEVFQEPEAIKLLSTTFGAYRSGDDDTELAELARLCARLRWRCGSPPSGRRPVR